MYIDKNVNFMPHLYSSDSKCSRHFIGNPFYLLKPHLLKDPFTAHTLPAVQHTVMLNQYYCLGAPVSVEGHHM